VLSQRGRHLLDFKVSRSDCGVADDLAVLDGDMRGADVVSELVLSRVAAEESIEIGIARMECHPIVGLAERSELNHRA
jgi:hypothetical protein